MEQGKKSFRWFFSAVILANYLGNANASDLDPDNWTTLRVCADLIVCLSQISRRKVLRTK